MKNFFHWKDQDLEMEVETIWNNDITDKTGTGAFQNFQKMGIRLQSCQGTEFIQDIGYFEKRAYEISLKDAVVRAQGTNVDVWF